MAQWASDYKNFTPVAPHGMYFPFLLLLHHRHVWEGHDWMVLKISASIDTSLSSAPPVSTGFGSFGVVGVHSTRSQQRHSSIHSCRHASITAMLFWRVRQKWRLTSFNEWWMLQLVWSPVHTSSTEDCYGYCTPNCTGSSLSESCTSSASWCTVAYTVRRRSTWSTSAYQSPTSLLGSISGPPVDDSWSFRDTGCKHTGFLCCWSVGLELIAWQS